MFYSFAVKNIMKRSLSQGVIVKMAECFKRREKSERRKPPLRTSVGTQRKAQRNAKGRGGGVRSLFLIVIPLGTGSLVPFGAVTAQVIKDNSLGGESSVVSGDVVIKGIVSDRIDGGASRGSNLFHSFQEFNVGKDRGVYFSNPAGIENILMRVTGSNSSNILGTLGVLGKANLFLINPNGVLFGANARLDLSGSFLASTAKSFIFDNNFEFSTNNPQAPPLLTVNVPLGLQFGESLGSIINNASTFGLEVQSGKSLALIGGNVRLDGGILTAPGGRVSLGGLTQSATVGLNPDGSLIFPLDVEKADVFLTNAAKVDVAELGRGGVAITARNLNIEKESRISAGIKPNLTADGSFPGDINLNATGVMTINQESLVENVVATGATGNTGNINVNANVLFKLAGGGRLRTRTLGKMRSDAGDINIKAGDIYISNPAYNIPGKDATKEDRPALDASNYKYDGFDGFGKGRSGDISLEANGSISLIGEGLIGEVDKENKVISTYNGNRALGGGNISLIAKGSISLDNAKLVSSSIFSQSDGAGDILLQGDRSISLTNNSALNATSYFTGNDVGKITLRSQGLVSLQSSLVSTENLSTNPNTIPGEISIFGQSVLLANGSEVSAKTLGGGYAGGNIIIDAKDRVEIFGINPLFYDAKLFFNKSRPQAAYSTLVTTTEAQANGPAGNITVNTGTLRVADGASLRAGTQGDFRGGNITVNARAVELIGGGKLLTNALGAGNAGTINLNVSDRIAISGTNPDFTEVFNEISSRERSIQEAEKGLGPVDTAASGIYASTSQNSTGLGGNLVINTTGQLLFRNGGQASVSNQGAGQAGDMVITARSIKLDNQGAIKATANSKNGGNISLNVKDYLLMEDNSIISTSAGANKGGGNGGNINIDAAKGFVIALPEQNNDIIANAFQGQGGKINIASTGIFGLTERRSTPLNRTNDIDASSEFGLAGTVTINTPDVDPSRGLVELPTNLVDPSQQIATACNIGDRQRQSSFIVTGRGGLPISPNQPLQDTSMLSEWVRIGKKPVGDRPYVAETVLEEQAPSKLRFGANALRDRQVKVSPQAVATTKIIEAQSWVVDGNGDIQLVAQIPQVNPRNSWQAPVSCPVLKR